MNVFDVISNYHISQRKGLPVVTLWDDVGRAHVKIAVDSDYPGERAISFYQPAQGTELTDQVAQLRMLCPLSGDMHTEVRALQIYKLAEAMAEDVNRPLFAPQLPLSPKGVVRQRAALRGDTESSLLSVGHIGNLWRTLTLFDGHLNTSVTASFHKAQSPHVFNVLTRLYQVSKPLRVPSAVGRHGQALHALARK